MSPFIKTVLSTVLGAFTKDNLKTNTTKAAAMTASAAVGLQAYPQTEYDALAQMILAVLSVYLFYKKN